MSVYLSLKVYPTFFLQEKQRNKIPGTFAHIIKIHNLGCRQR